ncbi:DNA topoisomerase 3 [Marinobacter sp. X15-166B]|uniref:DNA topoisomerase III n=1 Tax=Marinobacter sp. X15-166B TaxID=1897620 RepID=UPI00085C6BB8|nr:DNA topoisomerase III [Marinobacter sp. X15-166B]OEY65074.1 DNA topoisomerase III [Marinobacter sp. X15-166B]
MRLYIAEKPSLGRAIAAALPGPMQQGTGWIRCGTGAEASTVSWCIGHLLEPAEPGHYDPRWKHWSLADLPMLPERWDLVPKTSVKKQLQILGSLIRKATLIVHAGDPDREGQLLVDEVIRHFSASCPVQRVLINDLTPKAVAQALHRPRDNAEFQRLSDSALARQRADWLYGLNLTRYYTLMYRQQGADGVYSVGRVQTPVLGLVVQRDENIAAFTPRAYYPVIAQVWEVEHGSPEQCFSARWQADERYRQYLDEEDRLTDPAIARLISNEVSGRPGKVTEARFRDRREAPPLPLSLSALQIEAGRLFRMGAKQVLDTAQSLYEKHQLITYPRSDCRYLPDEHFQQREAVIAAIGRVSSPLAAACEHVNPELKSAAWNSARVDAHHGIIPTARTRPSGPLNDAESKVYNLISRFYLMQFCTAAIHREGRLTVAIGEHQFRASETAIAEPGWKTLELRQRDQRKDTARAPLPRLQIDAPVLCESAQVQERTTKPPQHFTDATLLAAMTNIARFVSDAELRKTLRDTDGLGTEATRANIIELLFKRDYLYRDARYIRATEKGHSLINALPDSIRQPDITAIWEATLESICQGSGDPHAFIHDIQRQVSGFITVPQAPPTRQPETGLPPAVHCPKCRAPMRKRDGKFGEFFACTRFPDCNGTRPVDTGLPQDGTSQKPIPCPHCFSPLVRRKGKKGWFWGCSAYPGCRHTADDNNGQPVLAARKP